MHDGLIKLLKLLPLITSKTNILGENNKAVVWSAAWPKPDIFGKGEPILVLRFYSPLPNRSDIEQQPTKEVYITIYKNMVYKLLLNFIGLLLLYFEFILH